MALVAKRYAEAFYHLARQDKAVSEYREELGAVAGILAEHEELTGFLQNPENGTENKKRALIRIFRDEVGEKTLHFILLLLEKSRLEYISEISREYGQMADEQDHVLALEIRSAKPLKQEEIDQITRRFRARYNAAQVRALTVVDPSLLGGIQVCVGDKLYDGTLKGKLSRLHALLSER